MPPRASVRSHSRRSDLRRAASVRFARSRGRGRPSARNPGGRSTPNRLRPVPVPRWTERAASSASLEFGRCCRPPSMPRIDRPVRRRRSPAGRPEVPGCRARPRQRTHRMRRARAHPGGSVTPRPMRSTPRRLLPRRTNPGASGATPGFSCHLHNAILKVTIARFPRTTSPKFMSIVAIINPISGAGADGAAGARRIALVRSEVERRGLHAEIHVTERAGHAHHLAAASAAAGAELVIVWGGDGTMNEAGAGVLHSDTAVALVRAGSGNGLAAALGVPRDPRAALAIALDGETRAIDAGLMAGRPFFNIAGIGFDARIATRFNDRAAGRRGAWPYLVLGIREGWQYGALDYRVQLDGEAGQVRALLISFANGREYGLGACI